VDTESGLEGENRIVDTRWNSFSPQFQLQSRQLLLQILGDTLQGLRFVLRLILAFRA
jgi:hypothetical protein